MYNLPYFKEKDKAVVLDFLRKHPFALLAGCDKHHQPVATQIPLLVKERGDKLLLSGHMMRNTDHHKAFVANPAVLCVFTGAHSYVSATWYSDPHQASTWNYLSVHARGQMHFLNEESLVNILRETSLYFEGNNRESSTAYDNLPDDYRQPLLKAIVAFEIEVTEMDNVFKLSQNHDQESFRNIITKLSEGSTEACAIAREMKKREESLFRKSE